MFPTKTFFDEGKTSVSLKETKTIFENFAKILFAKPKTESDSWRKIFLPKIFPAKQTGKEPKPPFEKINFGQMKKSKKRDWKNPNKILKKSKKFKKTEEKVRYLLIFPEET